MTDKEVMQMALDALECWQRNEDCNEPMSKILEALRAALAQPEPEPVAWMWNVNNGAGYSSRGIGFEQTNIPFAKHTPLYAVPPQPEPVAWVDTLDRARPDCVTDFKYLSAAQIERKEHLQYIALYPAMTKRKEWVGLTYGEQSDCLVEADPCECLATPEAEELMRSVEAKLKEKNHD